MQEKKYIYKTEKQLRELVDILGGDKVKITVTLSANVPERFFELRNSLYYNYIGEECSWMKERIARQQTALTELLQIAIKEKIHPLTGLSFNWVQREENPEYEHLPVDMKNLGDLVDCANLPTFFLSPDWRYSTVSLHAGKKRIILLKETVKNADPQKYHVTYVHATLNDRIETDEIGGHEDYDASLCAENGIITVTVFKGSVDTVVGKYLKLTEKLLEYQPNKASC